MRFLTAILLSVGFLISCGDSQSKDQHGMTQADRDTINQRITEHNKKAMVIYIMTKLEHEINNSSFKIDTFNHIYFKDIPFVFDTAGNYDTYVKYCSEKMRPIKTYIEEINRSLPETRPMGIKKTTDRLF